MIDSIRTPRLSGADGSASTLGSARVADKSSEDFASLLAGFAKQSVDTIRQGEQAAMSGINGSVPIQEVADKVMAAEQALQSALAVREKVITAWLEISRMTV